MTDRLINVPLPDAVSLVVDVSVPLREMREWSAARTGRYFAGIEMALEAIHGEPLGLGEPTEEEPA